MRITLTPNYESIEDDQPFNNPGVYRFAFEFYEASGNIHIINTEIIDEIYNNVNGDVVVIYEDNDRDIVENYNISSIEEL